MFFIIILLKYEFCEFSLYIICEFVQISQSEYDVIILFTCRNDIIYFYRHLGVRDFSYTLHFKLKLIFFTIRQLNFSSGFQNIHQLLKKTDKLPTCI